jgi:predicted ATPase
LSARAEQVDDVRQTLTDTRLVTLTGAGGVGKTRLAVEVAAQMTAEFSDGVWYVDLAPITDPDVVPVTVARALGMPDRPGSSTVETCCGSSATARCWSCSTTANTCSTQAPSWWPLSSVPRRG